MRRSWWAFAGLSLALTGCVFGTPKAVAIEVRPGRIVAETNPTVTAYVAQHPYRFEDVGPGADLERLSAQYLTDLGSAAIPFEVRVRCSLEGETIVFTLTAVFVTDYAVLFLDGRLVDFLAAEVTFTCTDGGRSFAGLVLPGGAASRAGRVNVGLEARYVNHETLREKHFAGVPGFLDPLSDVTRLEVQIVEPDDGYTPPTN